MLRQAAVVLRNDGRSDEPYNSVKRALDPVSGNLYRLASCNTIPCGARLWPA